MRQENKNFLQKMIDEHPENFKEPVLEIGSLQVGNPPEFGDIRPMFGNKFFVGTDMREGLGVDKIENVERLSFGNGSFGTVICLDTLEHVENIEKAMQEMKRVLEPGGALVISSVFSFPIHDYPNDYWRFTPECFRMLLKDMDGIVVEQSGGGLNSPEGVYGFGIKK